MYGTTKKQIQVFQQNFQAQNSLKVFSYTNFDIQCEEKLKTSIFCKLSLKKMTPYLIGVCYFNEGRAMFGTFVPLGLM